MEGYAYRAHYPEGYTWFFTHRVRDRRRLAA